MNPNSSQKRIAFGYNRDCGKLVVNPGQAACVKMIFADYLEEKSLGEIKNILEEMSVPSPHNGMNWSKQTISNILSNPHYIGTDGYTSLVSEEDFEAVQKIKEK